MIKIVWLFIAVAALALPAIDRPPATNSSARAPQPVFSVRPELDPPSAVVFAGATVRFRVRSAGASGGPVRWSVVGPGSIADDGTFQAPDSVGDASFVIASTSAGMASASVRIVAPPAAGERVAIVSCYDGGGLDVRSVPGLDRAGGASTGGRSAGIIADDELGVAFVAVENRIATFDLHTGAVRFSEAVPGARFSEIAMLGPDYVAATDNDAAGGQPGVRVFHISGRTALELAGSAIAGDTPEGIAVMPGGRTYFITNVNGNSVTEFAFDGHGASHAIRTAATGHRPFGMAVDPLHGLLFVADNDTATVSGTASKPGLEVLALPGLKRVTEVSTGSPDALPLGVAVDPGADRLFVTNEGDGDVVAYSISPLRRIAVAITSRTPWLPAVDTRRHLLYVPSASTDTFAVYDETSLRTIASGVSTCGYPVSIALY